MKRPQIKLITYLVMLSVIIGPVFGGVATALSEPCPEMLQHSNHDKPEFIQHNCDLAHSEECIEHPECFVLNAFSSLQPSSTIDLIEPVALHLRHVTSNSRLVTQYPEALIRPPNS